MLLRGAILGLTVALSIGSALADPPPMAEACHLPPEEVARIEALRAAMAVVDLTVHPGDQALGIGLGVIDSSCLTGPRAAAASATAARIRAAVQRATEQMNRCWERYRIVEGPDVASVLSRTRYFCQDPDGSGLVAQMRRTSRTYDSCGRGVTRYMDGAYRRYRMTISAPAEGLLPKINETASTEMPVDEFASFLAHEAMHVLAMNNRDWHNNFDPHVRTDEGCTSSLFEDRIYFTQAACFPASVYGSAFYGETGASRCPDLCRRALTEIDPEARTMYSASAEPGSERTGAFGPSQVARPYPAAEADRVCTRIATDRGASLR